MYLLTIGQTTNERVRKVYDTEKSPYFVSFAHSLYGVCCAALPASSVPDQHEVLSNTYYLAALVDSQEFELSGNKV
jgi:hypothetical protein